jgi:hypothetical protein
VICTRKRCYYCGKILYNDDEYKRLKTPEHRLAFVPCCPGCFKKHEKEVEEFDPDACCYCGKDLGQHRYIKEIGTGPDVGSDVMTNVYGKMCQDCLAAGMIKDVILKNVLVKEEEGADIVALLMRKKHVIGKLEVITDHVKKAYPENHVIISIDDKKENIVILNDAFDDEKRFGEILDFIKYVDKNTEILPDGLIPRELTDKCEGCPKRDSCPGRAIKSTRKV